MSGLKTWDELRSGISGEVVLAVDFPATGRAEADFNALAPLLATDHAVWRTLVEPNGLLRDVAVEEYIEPWLDEVRGSGLKVRAVLGFCVGGVYASVLAERIGQWQGEEPKVLLFDPELVNAETVFWQFYKMVGSMSQVLAPDEAAQLQAAGRTAFEANGENVQQLTATLYDLFEQAAAAAFARMGLGPAFAQDLLDLVGSFMSYLSIAEPVEALPLWRRAVALCSASQESGLNRVRDSFLLPEAELVAEEIVFASAHSEMLRDPEVARGTDRLIND
ncbi:hypothetical protein RKD23_003769 [Streptomyces sp. SAI-170]|uniref:hypothetical protein n=1 Tax=unclassified Streptomyces TaxID=2593676 RepID=UPI00380DF676